MHKDHAANVVHDTYTVSPNTQRTYDKDEVWMFRVERASGDDQGQKANKRNPQHPAYQRRSVKFH